MRDQYLLRYWTAPDADARGAIRGSARSTGAGPVSGIPARDRRSAARARIGNPGRSIYLRAKLRIGSAHSLVRSGAPPPREQIGAGPNGSCSTGSPTTGRCPGRPGAGRSGSSRPRGAADPGCDVRGCRGQVRYEPAQDVASAKPSRPRAFSGAGCWYVHSHTEPVAHFEIRSAGRHLWTCVLLDAEHLTVMGSDRTFVSEARASAAALAFSKLVNPSREDAGSPAEGWTGLSPGR